MDPFAPNHITNGANGSSNNVDTAAQSSSPCPSETMFDKLHKHVFCVDELRQMLQTTEPVDNNLANTVQRAIEQLPKQPLDHFYPPIVVSYSTDHRKGVDAKNAGPGYVVVGCLIRYLFENGIDCYTDMMTPVGCRWTEQFMNRVDSRRAKAMIAVLSPRFFWSVNCLNEICGAKERRLKIIPVMLQDHCLGEEDMWRIEDLEKYAKTHHPNNWLEIKRDLEANRLKAIEALKGIQTIPSRGTLLSDPDALGHLMRQLQHLAQPNSQVQHPLSPHGPMSPVVPVARRVVDDSCLRVVGYKFTNYVDCDEGNNREVVSCLDGLLASVQHFLQRHDDKKPIKHITAEPVTRNGKSVQLIRFDVGNMMQEMKDIARRCKKVELLLGKLATMVDASDDEIEMFRLMAVFEGSLIVMMEAPSSFFAKIQDMFQAGGNQIVVENNIHLIGIAQAFVVTIPRDLWPKDLEELCSTMSVAPAFDLISIKKPRFSLLVPTANEAFNKLMSNDVSNWRNPNDQAWNSFPAVSPLHEAEARRREIRLKEQRRAELRMSFPRYVMEDCIMSEENNDNEVVTRREDYLVSREFVRCGNELCSKLIDQYYDEHEASTSARKYEILQIIVEAIKATGGRFLKRVEVKGGGYKLRSRNPFQQQDHPAIDFVWREISDREAKQYVAYGFKEERRRRALLAAEKKRKDTQKVCGLSTFKDDSIMQIDSRWECQDCHHCNPDDRFLCTKCDGRRYALNRGSNETAGRNNNKKTRAMKLTHTPQQYNRPTISGGSCGEGIVGLKAPSSILNPVSAHPFGVDSQGLQGRSQSTDQFFQGSSSTPPVASQDDLSVDMSFILSDSICRSSVGEWECGRCGYLNRYPKVCAICGAERVPKKSLDSSATNSLLNVPQQKPNPNPQERRLAFLESLESNPSSLKKRKVERVSLVPSCVNLDEGECDDVSLLSSRSDAGPTATSPAKGEVEGVSHVPSCVNLDEGECDDVSLLSSRSDNCHLVLRKFGG